ncbi:MAG: hypothetical protein AAF399_02605 [Bacteroidota bacterium]
MRISTLLLAFLCWASTSLFAQAQPLTLTWDFPLPRTHTGVLMGNGVQGLMVWGEGQTLRITVGRAGFWDHRGGNDFSARTNYQQVKTLVQNKDDAGLKEAFGIGAPTPEGQPDRPHQVGGARIEIDLPDGWTLQQGNLSLANGILAIKVSDEAGDPQTLHLWQATEAENSYLALPESWGEQIAVNVIPSWEFTQQQLEKVGVAPPQRWQEGTSAAMMQTLPEDDPLAIGYRLSDDRVKIASFLGANAMNTLQQQLQNETADQEAQQTTQFWRRYWLAVPRIQLPDPKIQELIDYGLYKQACTTPPHGLAAGLQGPFLEAYQLPPWSADYHFNVNIEMIYWPTLATNRTEHLDPMWDLIKAWLPTMQATGEAFFGREGALMIPHAVDDRLQVVGAFWTGTIDHACTAWMAQLAWLHYRYTMDESVLEEIAWPLLQGAFEGYWAMTESRMKSNGNTELFLPVTVSPEFRGASMDAWGENASFQLAAYHMVAEYLQEAAVLMDKEADPRWQQVRDQLPSYSQFLGSRSREYPKSTSQRIGLWDGMDLITSHRHHSHLAAIYPFVTVDPQDPQHQSIVNNSLWHLTITGAGAWSGWCVPWASTLFGRINQSDAAVGWLHYFKDHYTNEGRGTLHNAWHQGFSVIGDRPWAKRDQNREIMQLDGGFGALTASMELLVQHRRDGVYILPDIPVGWQELSFDRIGTEGAFQVGATVENGEVVEVRVKSLANGSLRLWHGLGESFQLDGAAAEGEMIELQGTPGQEWILSR